MAKKKAKQTVVTKLHKPPPEFELYISRSGKLLVSLDQPGEKVPRVYRKRAINWMIFNRDPSLDLKVEIKNFTSSHLGALPNPVDAGYVIVPARKSDSIAAKVKPLQTGNFKYRYEIWIGGHLIDPEIIVCDDPEFPPPPPPKKAPQISEQQKAARKKAAKK